MSAAGDFRLRHDIRSALVDQSFGFKKALEWETSTSFCSHYEARTSYTIPDSVAMIIARVVCQ